MNRLVILVALAVISSCYAEHALVCEQQTLHLQCPEGKAINIRSANYGRTADGQTCPHASILTHDCRLDAAEGLIREVCQNQNSCSIPVTNGYFGNDPCYGTYKYVEVDYKCKRQRQPKGTRPGVHREVICESGTVSLSCPEGQTIKIQEADYGRSDGTTCPHTSILTTDCHMLSASHMVREVCEGENSCHFPATNHWFGNDPCYGTYKYVSVDYKCKAVRQRPTRHREVICEDDDITLECPEGQEIQIKRTTYGRQNKRECPSRNTEENKVKCNTNGANALKPLCDGESSCHFTANDGLFGVNRECEGTRKYVKLTYLCKTPRAPRKSKSRPT